MSSPHQWQDKSGPLQYHSSNTLYSEESSSDFLDDSIKRRTISPAERKSSQSMMAEDMTVNKLQFARVGLIGRQEQVKALHKCWKRAMSANTREFVLIAGLSGTGKSALCHSLQQRTLRHQGLIVSYKFDFGKEEEEAASVGVVAACRQLCGQVLQFLRDNKPEGFRGIYDKIAQELGQDLAFLIQRVPELLVVVVAAAADNDATASASAAVDDPEEETLGLKSAKNQMSYAVCKLIRVLSSCLPSLVFHLDDLQWADPAFLQFLQLLLTDDQLTHFVVLGCYRSNEVDELHGLTQIIAELQQKQQQQSTVLDINTVQEQEQVATAVEGGTLQITELVLDNLDDTQVQELLMDLLSSGARETSRLAQICRKKTLGNPFFLVQFLTMLHHHQLLVFNFGLLKWIWTEADILASSYATDNVVNLLQTKMKDLPIEVATNLLPIVACLGSSVPGSALKIVWDHYHQDDSAPCHHHNILPIEPLLATAVNEGFLEWHGLFMYRFVHDKIREAVFSLLDPGALVQLKSKVGRILVRELDDVTLDSYIFSVVNLLNESHSSNVTAASQKNDAEEDMDPVELATLNLRAAQKAVQASAFATAARHALRGKELLSPTNKWSDDHYDLTLALFSLAAEVQAYLGSFESMDTICEEVLAQTSRPLKDKFRVYNVLISTTANRNQLSKALELGLELLKKLGHKFPQSKNAITFSTVVGLLKTKRKIKKFTIESLDRLPIMTDPEKIQVMRLLDTCGTICYITQNKLLPLTVFKNFELTIRFGLCQYSPPAFATLGLILAGLMEDFDAATKIAAFVEKMTEKLKSRSTSSRTIFIICGFCLPWVRPLQSLTKILLDGYNKGLSTGDTESASWCITFYICTGLQSGRNLVLLEADCSIYIKQMFEMGCVKIALYTQMVREVIGHLTGHLEIPPGRSKTQTSSDVLRTDMDDVFKRRLYAILGAYSSGADLSIATGAAFRTMAPGNAFNMGDALYQGISLFAMARETKQSKFKVLALKQRQRLRSWKKKKCPNVVHSEFLLDAEHAALEGRNEKAKLFYEQAVAFSARAGFGHDAALASERFADFLLCDLKDREGAHYCMKQAIGYYSEWGAGKKVEMLNEKYHDLLLPPQEVMPFA